MQKPQWQNEVDTYYRILSKLAMTDQSRDKISLDEGFQQWCNMTTKLRAQKKTVYLIGNGASASMASHFAADLSKNANVHTQVFSDLSLITAISNDMGYKNVFAEPLKNRGSKGDMLVAISSSGESENILEATKVALELDIDVITLTGMKATNPLRTQGVLNAYIPSTSYGHTETCHAMILHHWMDMVGTPIQKKQTKPMPKLIQTITIDSSLQTKIAGL